MKKRSELVHFLITQANYEPKVAELTADDLLAAQPPIQQAFEAWQSTGALPELEIEGYTAQRLIEEYHFHAVAALLTLDWLITDPQEALTALKYGFDTVQISKEESQGASDADCAKAH